MCLGYFGVANSALHWVRATTCSLGNPHCQHCCAIARACFRLFTSARLYHLSARSSECKQQPPYANRSFSRHSTLGVMSPKLASIFVDRCKIASSLDCPSFLRLQMWLLIFAQEFKNLQGKSSLSSLLLSSSGCDFGLERKKFWNLLM